MDINTFKPRKLEIPVTEIEQASFCRLDDNLRSTTLEEEFKSGVKWQKVPLRYLKLKPDVIDSKIIKMKSLIGDKLFILGHHYQREEVIKFADTTGDYFKLSVESDKEKNAEYIVFCGLGGQSTLATKTMQEMGIKNVKNMTGGMTAWKDKK